MKSLNLGSLGYDKVAGSSDSVAIRSRMKRQKEFRYVLSRKNAKHAEHALGHVSRCDVHAPQLDREKIITRCRHSPTWPPNLPGAPGRPEVRRFHYFSPPIDVDIVKRSFCEPNPHTTVSSLHNIHLSSVHRSVRQYQATIHSTFWQFATITLTICYCYRLQ